jgi:hypothetical protein
MEGTNIKQRQKKHPENLAENNDRKYVCEVSCGFTDRWGMCQRCMNITTHCFVANMKKERRNGFAFVYVKR